MSEFKTFRVRVCEQRILAINVSAPDNEQACQFADSAYETFGTNRFGIIDSGINRDTFAAEEISGAYL